MNRYYIHTTHGTNIYITVTRLECDFNNDLICGYINDTTSFIMTLRDVYYIKRVNIDGSLSMVSFEDIKEI